MSLRRLIVNADDFGFTADVNAGIIEAHQNGILTAATLMANGPAFDDAVAQARGNPELDIGCHLVLVGAKPVAVPGRELPRNVRQLLWELLWGGGRRWIELELEAQVVKILRAGIQPTHLDTHKHTHVMPRVLEAVCRISERYSIPWVRRPFDLPLAASNRPAARAVNAALRGLRGPFDRVLARHHCRTTDHFAGFQWTGAFQRKDLAGLIRNLPDGLTEFMCHPGRCTAELRNAPTRLKQSREQELQALVSPEVRRALEEASVELTSYRALLSESLR
jgi:predicted glycoside hydrolase/deacetylase ChbG (UPF0249 family)